MGQKTKLEVIIYKEDVFLANPNQFSYSNAAKDSVMFGKNAFEEGNFEKAILYYDHAFKTAQGLPIETVDLKAKCYNLLALKCSLNGNKFLALTHSRKETDLVEHYCDRLIEAFNSIKPPEEKDLVFDLLLNGAEHFAIAKFELAKNLIAGSQSYMPESIYQVSSALKLVNDLIKDNYASCFLLYQSVESLIYFGDILSTKERKISKYYYKTASSYINLMIPDKDFNLLNQVKSVFNINLLKERLTNSLSFMEKRRAA